MKTSAEILGVYLVPNNPEVHLVEIVIKGSKQKLNIYQFTQEIPNQPRKYWQVPWDEKLLDESGEVVIANNDLLEKETNLWIGYLHLIFFFHYLDFSKPLLTPFGPLVLPKELIRPERLSKIIYESPD